MLHQEQIRNLSFSYLPGVSFGHISEKGEGLLSFLDVGGELDGETHIGTHLCRFEGLPWLCTGSKSKERFNVAQAIVYD